MAAVLTALRRSPTLDRVVRQASADAVVDGEHNRGAGEPLEHAVRRRLAGAGFPGGGDAEQVAAEVRAMLDGDPAVGGQVTAVVWTHRGGRSGRDFDLELHIAGQRPLLLPVNIKRTAAGTSERAVQEVAAVSNIIRAALGGDLDASLGCSVPRLVVRWAARRLRISGSDYIIWSVAAHPDGQVEEWSLYGVLSSAQAGRPVLSRHPNREVMVAVPPDGPLPAHMDADDVFAAAMLPPAAPDDLRAMLAAAVAADDPDDLPRVAAALDDADDDTVRAAVAAAARRIAGSV